MILPFNSYIQDVEEVLLALMPDDHIHGPAQKLSDLEAQPVPFVLLVDDTDGSANWYRW